MRRPWCALVGVLVLTLAALRLGAEPAAAGDNLLLNGGFEDGKAYWNNVTNIVTTPVHGGAKAASLSCAGVCSIRQLVAVEAGASYNLSAWVYDDAPNVAVWLSVDWLNSESLPLGSVASARLTTDQKAYRTLALGSILAPASARSARIHLQAQSATGEGGVIYYDDALLVKVSGPPATPSATRTATCTPTATPTWTATRRPTFTATRTATSTVPATQTATSTNSATATPAPTATATPTDTATVTPTVTPTVMPTDTVTVSPTDTATAAPTETATAVAPAPRGWLPLIQK